MMSKQLPVQSQHQVATPPAGYPQNGPLPTIKRAKLSSSFTDNSQSPIASPRVNPQTPSELMPPPLSVSPTSRGIDPFQLSDVLMGSGIDIRNEEMIALNLLSNHSTNLTAEEQANRLISEQSYKNHHIYDPFLLLGEVQKKIQNNIRKSGFMATSRGGDQYEHSDICVLISMAAQEKLREIIHSAHQLAVHRRKGNQVRGLGEFADKAMGEGEGENGKLKTAEEPESAISPGTANPRKRSFSQAQLNTSQPTAKKPRQPKLISTTAKTLRDLALIDRLREEARLEYRAKALALKAQGGNAAEAAGGASPSVAPEPGDESGVSTPGAAPGLLKRPTLSVKESKKAAAAKMDDAYLHKAANETASIMLGGRKKNKYSWMGGLLGANNPAASAANASTPGTPLSAPTPQPMYWTRRMGEWNEQGDRGKNIQLRDWNLVLESDGREKVTLQKAFLKMK